MIAYILLALAFVLAMIGATVGASTNDPWMMVAGTLPGLLAIFGLMVIYGRE